MFFIAKMNTESLSTYDSVLQKLEHLDVNKTSHSKIVNIDNTPLQKPNIKKSFKCTICNVKSSSSKDLANHIKGRKHLTKSRLANSVPVQNFDVSINNLKADQLIKGANKIICDLCNVTVSGQVNIDEHISGKKHMLKAGLASSIPVQKPDKKTEFKARVTQSQISNSDNDIVDKYPTRKPRRQNPLRCTICNVQSSSNIDFEMHMNGKRHFENARFNNSIEVESSLVSMSNYDSQSVTDEFEVASIKF